tara:strand:+ start:222067 stop:223047 length:981 start_codon:yes stop_codon:yes gene_type:complete
MNNQPSHSNQSEEIDLGYIFKKLNDLFKKSVKLLFEVIAFFLKFKIIVMALIIVGAAYGYYVDSKTKTVYDNKAIVIPNFESVDYLYDKIEALNSKIESRDTLYLKKILDSDYRHLKKIQIEPIADIYNFIAKSRENIDIFRIFTQNQDIEEYMEEFSNSKYYKYHKLNFKIKGKNDSENIVANILKNLNDNQHYYNYGEVYRDNTDFQIVENKNMIRQIDTLLSSASKDIAQQTSQGVVINDNSNFHNLIERKRLLMDELLTKQKQSVDYRDIIKVVNIDYNIEDHSKLSFSPIIKYPIYLLIIFSLTFFFIYSYKKLKNIAENK